jgi:hypothetical protein
VLANGLDVETRRAVKYWRTTRLDVRPWIYRSYAAENQMLLEIAPFRTADDPLEDQSESQGDGFYVVNTNFGNEPADDAAMLKERKVAALLVPWKLKIARLKRDDRIFLYRSGTGVVAIGKAGGKLKRRGQKGKGSARESGGRWAEPLRPKRAVAIANGGHIATRGL